MVHGKKLFQVLSINIACGEMPSCYAIVPKQEPNNKPGDNAAKEDYCVV